MIERIVAFCTHRPWLVIGLCGVLTALGLFTTITRFSINTETARLIAADVPWRLNEAALDKAFPQRTDLMLVVIDGDTPERAAEASDRLAQALGPHDDLLRSVRQPDSGPFFDRNGLLFLSTDELARTTEQLIAQQAFLGPLAADPSLRGLMGTLTLGAQGIAAGETTLDELAGADGGLSDGRSSACWPASRPGCPGRCSCRTARPSRASSGASS